MTDSSLLIDATAVRQRINLLWLVRLRWGAAMGQAAVIMAVAFLFDIALPLPPILWVLAITVASNAMVTHWSHTTTVVQEAVVGMLVALDIVQLSVLLYFTGGPTNPFNFLYLVHIALAAVILRLPWMAALVTLACTCFVGLFWFYVPLPSATLGNPHGMSAALQKQGVGVAFALAAIFIVYFVHRLTAALAQSEKELAVARDISARNERLTSLATLAAGAAHELSTPLATIAVVAKELERHLSQHSAEGCDDARLIRQEVERCRTVLTQMAADAGASSGESFVDVTVDDLLQLSVDGLHTGERVNIELDTAVVNMGLRLPVRSLSQAVRAVIKNALEASPATAAVDVSVAAVHGRCRIRVSDLGTGMPADVMAHVSEPFFTTKPPGAGMGLGLFLTRTLLERLGGSLELSSTPGFGTTVVLVLPSVACL